MMIWCHMWKSLWPSDAIRRHRLRSTLTKVMAFCLTAPSHYLKQRWRMRSGAFSWSDRIRMAQDINLKGGFGSYIFYIISSPRVQFAQPTISQMVVAYAWYRGAWYDWHTTIHNDLRISNQNIHTHTKLVRHKNIDIYVNWWWVLWSTEKDHAIVAHQGRTFDARIIMT